MLAIVKIHEGFVVVDLDEDTPMFESLEEAQEFAGGVLNEKRSEENRMQNDMYKDSEKRRGTYDIGDSKDKKADAYRLAKYKSWKSGKDRSKMIAVARDPKAHPEDRSYGRKEQMKDYARGQAAKKITKRIAGGK